MSGRDENKPRVPLSDIEAESIESALDDVFAEATPDEASSAAGRQEPRSQSRRPDEDARYDPFAADDDALIGLELPPPSADGPTARGPLVPGPAHQTGGGPPSPSAVPAAPPAPSPELAAAWQRAAAALDDQGAQQRFVQACLSAQSLPFAVRCYRSLAEPPHEDPRAARQLKKVGALLGFHAPPVQLEDAGMSPRLKLMLVGIGLAGLALAAVAWLFGG